jgi:hypothetical protein
MNGAAVPLHPFQVGGKKLLYGELPGLAQVDQAPEVIQEDVASGGLHLLAQQQALDAELLFGVRDGGADVLQRHRVSRAQRPQHVGLYQVVERKPRAVRVGGRDQRLERADTVLARVRTTHHPRADGRGGNGKVPRGIRKPVGRQLARVVAVVHRVRAHGGTGGGWRFIPSGI